MIRKILKYLLNDNKKMNSIKANMQFVQIGNACSTENVEIEIRNPVPGHIYLKIGNGSIVSGKFVFESSDSSITIGDHSFLGGGVYICKEKIEIGSNVMISWGCTLIDNNAHSLNPDERKDDVKNWKRGLDEGMAWKYKDWSKVKTKRIIIEDNVWVGFNSIILKGVHIRKEAIIGAGSVVTKDVSEKSTVAGNPAQEIN